MDKPGGEQITTTKEHPDLFKKVVKGGFWVFSLRIFTQVLSFVRLTVLARLLTPDDFGILGIALLVMSMLETFSNTGFNAALIQQKKDIRPYLDTAWTISVIRGVVLFGLLYAVAPLAAQLRVAEEKIPLVINVIRVTGISFLLNGLTNIGIVYFQKELQFHKKFIMGSLTNIVSVAASIVIAIVYRTVWALVLGRLMSNILNCMLSYYLHPYRPKLRFNIEKAKELWNFGRWITANTILGFIMTQGDDLFVWAYLGPTSLAYYQMAYKISQFALNEITRIINNIVFPAYSKIQNNTVRLRGGFIKILENTLLVSLPLSGIIFIYSPIYTRYILGSKWIPIIIPLQILSIVGAIKTFNASSGPIYFSLAKGNFATIINSIRFLFFIALMIPFTLKFKITGTALAILLTTTIITPMNITLLSKVLQTQTFKLVKPIYFPILLALALIISTQFTLTHIENTLLSISICLIIIIAVFLLICFKMKLKDLIKNLQISKE